MAALPFGNAYFDRRVLVTGHTGFKGSWLTTWLLRLGARVVGYALEPDVEPSLFRLADLNRRCDSVIADVRDGHRLLEVFREYRPEVVFHLAAQPLVRRSYREPKETFEVNVAGTWNLLEAIRLVDSVQAAVLITTDKVYENKEWVYGYREEDPLGGHDPYSASKAAAEIAIQAYIRAFFLTGQRQLGVASARAGNVVGGGDWAEDRILPDALRALQAGRALRVRHPEAVRPWQHVLEPLAGYLLLGARLLEEPERFSGAWNFGPLPTDVLRVGELVDVFYQALGRGNWEHVPEGNALLHEAGLLKLAIDKAADALGWKPVWTARQAVERAASWYRGVMDDRGDAWLRCLQDIDDYERAAREAGMAWAS